jgi:hypothetical protein
MEVSKLTWYYKEMKMDRKIYYAVIKKKKGDFCYSRGLG